MEGTCTGRYGFVVLVTNIKSIGEARALRCAAPRSAPSGSQRTHASRARTRHARALRMR